MGAACCAPGVPAVLRITLESGEDLPSSEVTNEAEVFVLFKYGNLKRNRYQTMKSSSITTHDGDCKWDNTIEFQFGDLGTIQDLEVSITDKELFKSNEVLGSAVIRRDRTKEPKNTTGPEASISATSLNRDKTKVKYLLPNSYNEEKSYELELRDKDAFNSGRIFLKIELDNHKNKSASKVDRTNQDENEEKMELLDEV